MTLLDFINEKYPVRRTTEQKKAFQEFVLEKFPSGPKKAVVETTKDGKNENIILGNPLSAKVVCVAHYDTPMSSLLPNLMLPRSTVAFVLYQILTVLPLIAIALIPTLIVNAIHPLSRQELLLMVLVLYYVPWYLMFFAFKNPKNHNDNTSGVSVVLSLAERLEDEQLKNVAFILFDNEEKGKKGSKAFFADHKEEMKDRLVINFDCVGNGENFLFITMKEAENKKEYALLKERMQSGAGYQTYFYPAKGSHSNSDHKNFPCGVGCEACKRTKGGMFYTPRIHTPRDIVADNANIEFLVSSMHRYLKAVR